MNTKKIFIRFLKENNCLFLFKSNFYNDTKYKLNYSVPCSISDFFEVIDPFCYIDYAFKWNRTPQGQRFWANKNDAWKDFLNKTIQGFNFWDSLHKKWTALLDKMRINNYEFEA